jgi:hypothetical protein
MFTYLLRLPSPLLTLEQRQPATEAKRATVVTSDLLPREDEPPLLLLLMMMMRQSRSFAK